MNKLLSFLLLCAVVVSLASADYDSKNQFANEIKTAEPSLLASSFSNSSFGNNGDVQNFFDDSVVFPTGWERQDSWWFFDYCLNMRGIQKKVPDGYRRTGYNCYRIRISATSTVTTDMCANIAGVQNLVPNGYVRSNGQCVQAGTPVIVLFAAKDPNPTTKSVTITWESSIATDASMDVVCTPGTISFTTEKGNRPSCEKGGIWSWENQIGDSFKVTSVGNTEAVTVPFTLTLTKNGSPTNQSQTINITFPPSVSSASTTVVDLCENISGAQTSVPAGYVRVGDQCTQPTISTSTTVISATSTAVIDLCTNISGAQTTVPAGYTRSGNQCTPTPSTTDLCLNLPGVQTTVPSGYTRNSNLCIPAFSGGWQGTQGF